MIITFISDTHGDHKLVTKDLPGGNIIIHSGDISSMWYFHELKYFLEWFSKLNYDNKIFISGNHDYHFQNNEKRSKELLNNYDVIYLQDNFIYIGDHLNPIKIYGSPWQPRFLDWAFNLDRNGKKLKEKWSKIDNDTDILITHGPPHGHLDLYKTNIGCELLRERIDNIRPKIHTFGHIHNGYGYKDHNGTHFINSSVLDERYMYTNKPLTIEWDYNKNEILKFI